MKTSKQEIYNTRKGGLGGSDARMILKIGRNGIESLSETDKKRFAVLTGQIEYKPINTNAAMERGNDFEAYLAENVYPNIPNNTKIVLENNPFSFDVFAHADFYFEENKQVVEAKCTSKNIEETAKDYEAQLQWYFLLGAESVYLQHVNQTDDFHNHKTIAIYMDLNIIGMLMQGLNAIDIFIKDWIYEPKEDWNETDLLPWNQDEIIQVYEALSTIKDLEEKIEQYKENIKILMRDNNVKNINSDYYQISYVGESVSKTFDKAKLLKEHPEIKESDYQKTSKRSDFIKIKLT